MSECLERIDNGKSFTCDSNAREGVFPAILKLSAATYGDYRPYENKALLDEKQFVESVEVHRGDLLLQERIHLILLEWQPMFSKHQKNL